jgi:hypothetical protein
MLTYQELVLNTQNNVSTFNWMAAYNCLNLSRLCKISNRIMKVFELDIL